ncbi:neutral ceramidase-like protein, partial [Leptotrombidium deliense]
MSLLKFMSKSGRLMGTIAWFPVHSTSMNNTNRLISGDNKGYASMRFEQEMNSGYLPGKGAFVAAFPNANEGDVSPNIKGAKCIDTGAPCDLNSSTCETTVKIPVTMKIGKRSQNINTYTKKSSEKCIAFGPGNDMFQSTQIIGEKQYQTAKLLTEKATEKVTGDVTFIHQFIDMSNVSLIWNGHQVHTCKSAMGMSFAAGTTDGPGAFDFTQGVKKSTPVWNMVRDFIKKPSIEMVKCHYPKPILVATGIMKFPYDWQPQIIPTQIITIGNVVIVGLPAEFTTMSGRRIRETVEAEIARFDSNKKYHIVLSGLSNEYSSYVTTFEEYQAQRYEGASTIYGPHTLEAYRQQFRMLASNLMAKLTIPDGPTPPNLLKKQITLKPGVLYDGAPSGSKFGDVMLDVKPHYYPGNSVFASCISANQRNDLQTELSFFTIEYLNPKTKQWNVIATDANWETKLFWHRTKLILGENLT